MADKRYQVFISSTFSDLVEERQLIMKSIIDLEHIPSGMELFPAADEDQFEYIKHVIDECDYYVLIIGARYGSVNDEGISYTEREYDYAVETGKNVIALVHGAVDTIPIGKADKNPELTAKLNDFRDRVRTGRLVSHWDNRENLQLLFIKSFMHATRRYPGVGWIRADTIANTAAVKTIGDLQAENSELRKKLADIAAQMRPSVEDAADLDDIFSLRYSWSEFTNGRAVKRHNNTETTWRNIFFGVAFQLVKPTSTKMLDTYINKYLREERIVSRGITLNEVDVARVKTQMSVLGLFKVFVAQNTAGSTDEFMELTTRGKMIKTELIAVRKDQK